MQLSKIYTLCGLLAALTVPATANDVIVPADGTLLNRLHAKFRWEANPDIVGDYELRIVEDNGMRNPFANQPVLTYPADGSEPRTVITEGLEFDKPYAWKVHSQTAGGDTIRTDIRRFQTGVIHPDLFVPELIVPPGAPPVQPGLIVFVARRNFGTSPGFITAMDEAGKIVYHHPSPSYRMIDLSPQTNGRVTFISSYLGGTGPCREGVEMTLDGKFTWGTPEDDCFAPDPPFEDHGVHHEFHMMPNGNFVALEYDNRIIPGSGAPGDWWQGDRVNVYDRHTKKVLKTWSTFDDYCLDDYFPAYGPGDDWQHCNSAAYDEANDLIYVSARHHSAISAVFVDSGSPTVQMTEAWRLGENSFPCGDVPPDFGDNMFSFQHAPERQPNGNLLLFNNGNYIEPLANPRVSSAVEMALDFGVNPPTATKVWEYRLVQEDLTTPAYGPFVGDADRLPNGNTIISEGPTGIIVEVDSNGDIAQYYNTGPGWPGDMANPGQLVYRVSKIDELITDTPSDTDEDWDVDLHDLAEMQLHFTGPGPASLTFPATLSDSDGDDDIDEDDMADFVFWMSGPGI